ncbi:unnamed protein product [Albugo candida]|uniref:Uncharacterized protein n=1 Tax=Albugo candida TaxID=65357 RepID=A0A024GI93_9STRA|nr:unnamed protein product [Albugo candida]|eukprot:CCI46252.1 unnamed protein product [Albugo candida]
MLLENKRQPVQRPPGRSRKLYFKHKELTNHAEKLQQQVDMLSSQEVNGSSLYDNADLQTPCAGGKEKESEYLHAIQQKLVHLLAVQRQLQGVRPSLVG